MRYSSTHTRTIPSSRSRRGRRSIHNRNKHIPQQNNRLIKVPREIRAPFVLRVRVTHAVDNVDVDSRLQNGGGVLVRGTREYGRALYAYHAVNRSLQREVGR